MLDRELCLPVALAVCRQVGDATGAADEDEPSGKEAAVHVAREVGVEAAQASPVETDGGGIDFDSQITHGIPLTAPRSRGAETNPSRRRHR